MTVSASRHKERREFEQLSRERAFVRREIVSKGKVIYERGG